MQILQESSDWLADGTFKTVPALFAQLYTIHSTKFNGAIPLVFALLPNKNPNVYKKFLTALKTLKDGLNPRSIITDYEMAAINSFKNCFPNAEQKGCFFHFAQSLYRKIQAEGLQQHYSNDPGFSLQLRMLAAIAMVPQDEASI